MPRVFLNYRRDDTGVLVENLATRIDATMGPGATFVDKTDVVYGGPFSEQLRAALDEADVVVAVVGERWRGPRPGLSFWLPFSLADRGQICEFHANSRSVHLFRKPRFSAPINMYREATPSATPACRYYGVAEGDLRRLRRAATPCR